jgi:hypothetical protein
MKSLRSVVIYHHTPSEKMAGAEAMMAAIAAVSEPTTVLPEAATYPGPRISMISSNKRFQISPTGSSSFTLTPTSSNGMAIQFFLPTNVFVDTSSLCLEYDATLTVPGLTSVPAAVYGFYNSGWDIIRRMQVFRGSTALMDTEHYNNLMALNDMHFESIPQSRRMGVILEGKSWGATNTQSGNQLLFCEHKGGILGYDSVPANAANNTSHFVLPLRTDIFASKRILSLEDMGQLELRFTLETLKMAMKCFTGGYQGTEQLTITNLKITYRVPQLPANMAAGIRQSTALGRVNLVMNSTDTQTTQVSSGQNNANLIFNWRNISLSDVIAIAIDSAWANSERVANIGNFSGWQIQTAQWKLGGDYYPPQPMSSYSDFFQNLEDCNFNNGNAWDYGKSMQRLRALPVQGSGDVAVIAGPYQEIGIAPLSGTTIRLVYPNLWWLDHDRSTIDWQTNPGGTQPVTLSWYDLQTLTRNGFCVAQSFNREFTPGITAGINMSTSSVNMELIVQRSAPAAQGLFIIAYAFFQRTWAILGNGSVTNSA